MSEGEANGCTSGQQYPSMSAQDVRFVLVNQLAGLMVGQSAAEIVDVAAALEAYILNGESNG